MERDIANHNQGWEQPVLECAINPGGGSCRLQRDLPKKTDTVRSTLLWHQLFCKVNSTSTSKPPSTIYGAERLPVSPDLLFLALARAVGGTGARPWVFLASILAAFPFSKLCVLFKSDESMLTKCYSSPT